MKRDVQKSSRNTRPLYRGNSKHVFRFIQPDVAFRRLRILPGTVRPRRAKYVTFSMVILETKLSRSRKRGVTTSLNVPLCDGSFEMFTLSESPVWNEHLARAFPNVHILQGVSQSSGALLTMEVFEGKVSAMAMNSAAGQCFMEPAGHGISVLGFKKDMVQHPLLVLEDDHATEILLPPFPMEDDKKKRQEASYSANTLKQYRLAILPSKEYYQFFQSNAATVAANVGKVCEPRFPSVPD